MPNSTLFRRPFSLFVLLLAGLCARCHADGFAGPFASWANVKTAYGAKGDGTTDDAPAIQQALNDVGSLTSSKPEVVYLPAGTYLIKSTLQLKYKYDVAVIGADPATTRIVWGGPAGSEMFVSNGATKSHWARFTLDGQNVAGTAFHINWDGTPYYNTTNMEFDDCVFENVAKGLVGGGSFGNNDAEVGVFRCTFSHCSKAAVSIESFNALDYWIWDSTFLDNAIGATNEFGAGGFHVYRDLFERSTVADVTIGNTGFFSLRGNTSYQSNQFFIARNVGQNGAPITIQGNTILDTVNPVAIDISDLGLALIMDNNIRTPSGVGPVVHMEGGNISGGDLVSVGNTYTATNPVLDDTQNPRSWTQDDQVVDPSQINGTLPTQPLTLRALTNVFEVPLTATTAGIQTIINQAVASGNHPVVHFPQGNYSITQSLVVPANSDVMIIGDGYRSQLNWKGSAPAALIRLLGPSKAILADLSLQGVTGADVVSIENADQPGARVYTQGVMVDENAINSVLADGLANTHVDLVSTQHGRPTNAMQSVSSIGIGNPSESRIAIYGGTGGADGSNGGAQSLYSVFNGGRLLVEDTWYEGSQNPRVVYMDGTNSGVLNYEAGALSQISAGQETGGSPLVQLNGFDGIATFVNLEFAMASANGGVNVQNQPADGSTVVMGLSSNISSYLTENNSQGTVSFLNNKVNDGTDGAQVIPDQGTPRTASAIRENFGLIRTQTAQPLAESALGITDVRLYRLVVENGSWGIHVKSSGGTTTPVDHPTITPALPTVAVGQTVQLQSDIPVTWSLAGMGQIATSADGKSVTYTAPPSIVPQHMMAGCPVLPNDVVFNTPIDGLPLHPLSANWTSPANAGASPISFQSVWGVSIADNNTPAIDMKTSNDSVDHGTFLLPLAPELKREAGDLRSRMNGTTHHIVTVRKTDCSFWESVNDLMGKTYTCGDGSLGCAAQSAAEYPWSQYNTVAGPDAAGLPLAALTLHLDEVESGAIHHALQWNTCPTCVYSGAPLWPSPNATAPSGCATGHTNIGGNDCSLSPVFGARLRLKNGFDVSSFNAAAQTILTALKKYGMILSDTGPSQTIASSDDMSEDLDVQTGLTQIQNAGITIDQFEAVDESTLMIATGTWQANPSNTFEPISNSAIVTATPSVGTAVTIPMAIRPITIGLNSPTMTLMANTSYSIPSWVNGSTNAGVTWSLISGVGSVSSTGLYTAPATQAPGTTSQAVLKAVAAADPNVSTVLKVTILPFGTNPAGSIRVDVGAASATLDGNGNTWLPDLGVEAGTWDGSNDPSPWISTSVLVTQYQSSRHTNGNDAVYHFVVPNGAYKVHFLFGQTQTACAPNCPSTFDPTSIRPLNLETNGVTGISNFDFGASIGDRYATPSDAMLTAIVTDQTLSVALRGVLTDAAASNGAPSNAASPSLNGLEITLDPNFSYITIDTSTIHGLKAGQTIQLKALGFNMANTVTWQVTSGAGTGTIDATTGIYTAPASVTLTTEADIQATSTLDVSKTATVSLYVAPLSPAGIFLSTQTISLNGINSKTLTLKNDGDVAMTWTAVPSEPWLNVSTTGGTLNGSQTVSLTLSTSANTLAPGNYSEVVILFAPNVANSPQFIWVNVKLGNGGASSAETLGPPQPRVYPNPWRSDRHQSTPIIFDSINAGSTIKIFTLSGRLVTTLTASASGTATWDPQTGRAASGLYLYLVDSNGQKATGKFAVIR